MRTDETVGCRNGSDKWGEREKERCLLPVNLGPLPKEAHQEPGESQSWLSVGATDVLLRASFHLVTATLVWFQFDCIHRSENPTIALGLTRAAAV